MTKICIFFLFFSKENRPPHRKKVDRRLDESNKYQRWNYHKISSFAGINFKNFKTRDVSPENVVPLLDISRLKEESKKSKQNAFIAKLIVWHFSVRARATLFSLPLFAHFSLKWACESFDPLPLEVRFRKLQP